MNIKCKRCGKISDDRIFESDICREHIKYVCCTCFSKLSNEIAVPDYISTNKQTTKYIVEKYNKDLGIDDI